MKASLLALVLILTAAFPGVAAPPAPDAPGDMTGYDGYQGQTLHFMVQGAAGGHVWGTDVYTLDSTVALAAIHAGAVKPGEKKEVAILILPGQASYHGSSRNGVSTNDYGQYRGSYRFLKSGEAAPDPNDAPLQTSGNVMAFKARVGETLLFKVTGAVGGSVWGTGVYTADSILSAAAVHAGLVRDGETANLRVTILPGQASYQGSESHGVTSLEYGDFDASFRFETKLADEAADKNAAKSSVTDPAPKKP